jgi:cellobiose-specific phosphotransferase system component IIC
MKGAKESRIGKLLLLITIAVLSALLLFGLPIWLCIFLDIPWYLIILVIIWIMVYAEVVNSVE